MAFNEGDIVQHAEHGVGEVKHIRDDNVYWVMFEGKKLLISTRYEELTSRPDLRQNNEGRRWNRPPIGIHKPYRKK